MPNSTKNRCEESPKICWAFCLLRDIFIHVLCLLHNTSQTDVYAFPVILPAIFTIFHSLALVLVPRMSYQAEILWDRTLSMILL